MMSEDQKFNEFKRKVIEHLESCMDSIPQYDEEGTIEKSYRFDDENYVIQNGNVFKSIVDEGYQHSDEVTPAQLEIYGEELIEKPCFFEFKVLDIKEKEDGSALITGEDGCGLEIVFEDTKYFQRKEEYTVGEIGCYYLWADVLSCELPDDYAKGICLQGEDATRWFQWTEQEEYIGLVDEVWTNLESASVYSKTPNFNDTGIYNFYSLVIEPSFVGFDENPVYDKDGDLIYDTFKLVLPHQFNKAEPKLILACILTGKFPARIFQNLPEDEDTDFDEGGWAIKGTVKFTVEYGDKWWVGKYEDEQIIRLYGKNPGISYLDRMEMDEDYMGMDGDYGEVY